MKRVRLAALLISICSTPLSAQSSSKNSREPDLFTTSFESVFSVCPRVLEGTIDLNDPVALAPSGLKLPSVELEASMRSGDKGSEYAIGRFDDGVVFVGAMTSGTCSANIMGATRMLVRDAIIDRFMKTGGVASAGRSIGGAEATIFMFRDMRATVLTNMTTESVMIRLVKVKRKN